MEKNVDEAWAVWEEFWKDAIEGKWEDASERHDFYLFIRNKIMTIKKQKLESLNPEILNPWFSKL